MVVAMPHTFDCSPTEAVRELGSQLPRGPTHAGRVCMQYVSEAAAAIADSSVKTKDVGAAVQVGTLLCLMWTHQGHTMACQTAWSASQPGNLMACRMMQQRLREVAAHSAFIGHRCAPCCTSAMPTSVRTWLRGSSMPSGRPQQVTPRDAAPPISFNHPRGTDICCLGGLLAPRHMQECLSAWCPCM